MASRELRVNIIGDADSLNRAFGQAGRSSSKLSSGLRTLGKVAAVGVGAAFVGLAITVKKGFDELAEGEQVAAQTAARLKSTGNAAHVTAQQVEELATAQSKLTGIDDEAIQAGENMLLTFTNIRNEVGLGNNIFDQATVAIEDMATAMNDGAIPSAEQLSTTAIRVGKALNDPVKGMTALSRVGVQFTADQKKAIEAMVKSGDTMGAQKLIIAELTKEFGGSAKAAGETFPGQLAKLRNAFDDAAGKVAVVFLPALTSALGFITDKLIPGLGKAADFIGKFWRGISKQFANAPDFKAKVKVAFEGIENLARQFVDALVGQITSLLPQKEIPLTFKVGARGGAGAGGAAAISAGVDWDAVAADMIAALSLALQQSVELGKALAQTVNNAIQQVDWVGAGQQMGPGFAQMLGEAVKTILDPAFWFKNWELTLSIATVAFGGTIEKFAVQIGGRLSAVLLKMVASISPTFAAALGRLMADAGLVAVRILDDVGSKLFRLATAIFGRLTRVAVFTIKVLGVAAAISAIEDFVRGAIAKFKELLDWLSRLPGQVSGWATEIGRAIVTGILNGMGNLFTAVKDKIVGGVQGAIDGAMGIFGHSPQEVIGVALIDGIVRGWNKAVAKGNLKDKMVTSVNEAIDAAQQAILGKQGVFASAFDALVSNALSAFDKITSEFETKTERLIRKQDEAAAAADRKRALAEANAALASAQETFGSITQGEGESTEDFVARLNAAKQAIADAVQAREDALFAIQRAADERTAAAERKAYEEKRERQRLNLENQLQKLQQSYLNQEITTQQFHNRLIAIFKKFEVPLGKAANKVGLALAQGLNDSFGKVQAAAKALAQEILNQFSRIRVIVNIETQVKEQDTKQRQHGGPVRRGTPYVVGEAGPELFIPSSSGTVISNAQASSGRALNGGGGVQVIVYGDVTGDEIVQKVRKGLLDIGLYNPGMLGGRA